MRAALVVSLVALVLGGSAGCVARVRPAAGTVVVRAPPPPMVEVVPLAPGPGHVWVDGYWSWSGTRYVWQPGHYVRARVGAVWVRPRWERSGRYYRFVPGRWVARGEPRVYRRRGPPPPPSRRY